MFEKLLKKLRGENEEQPAQTEKEVEEYYLIEDTDASKQFYAEGLLGKKITYYQPGKTPKMFFFNPYMEYRYKWQDTVGLNLASTHRPKMRFYHIEQLGIMPIHTIKFD